MDIVKECLLIKSGVAVVTDSPLTDAGTFKFRRTDDRLVFSNGEIGVPIGRDLLAHLEQEEQNTFYFYGGSDSTARVFLGQVDIGRDQVLIAKGILWALAGGEEADPTPKKLPVEGGDSQYAGLRLPPKTT